MKNFQRDYFIEALYKKAKKNKNIILLSADFGAPALDKFQKKFEKSIYTYRNFRAKYGKCCSRSCTKKKKVFVYAMAPLLLLGV